MISNRFVHCRECINKDFDPFQCESCREGSHFEAEHTEEELTVHELLDLMRGD